LVGQAGAAAGSSGITIQKMAYAMSSAPPVAKVSRRYRTRAATGSIPRYRANPAQTPPSIRSVRERRSGL